MYSVIFTGSCKRFFRPHCPNGVRRPVRTFQNGFANQGIYSVYKELDYATNFAENGGGEWKESGDLGAVSCGRPMGKPVRKKHLQMVFFFHILNCMLTGG